MRRVEPRGTAANLNHRIRGLPWISRVAWSTPYAPYRDQPYPLVFLLLHRGCYSHCPSPGCPSSNVPALVWQQGTRHRAPSTPRTHPAPQEGFTPCLGLFLAAARLLQATLSQLLHR